MYSFLKTPDWESDGATWPNRSASRFVEAGKYQWHVQRMGRGPAILLLHGTGAATHSWARLAPLLAQTFEVVAVDLPGHGFTKTSAWAAPSLPHMANELGELLKKIDLKPAIVVGHSAGVAIMVRMVRDAIISPTAIVSINGALAPFGGSAGFMFPVMAKVLFYNPLFPVAFARGARNMKRVRRLIGQTGSDIPEDNVRHYAALMKRPGHIAGALGMMAHWDLSDMNNMIAEVTIVSVFLAGENDKAVAPSGAEKAAALAPKGRSITLPGLGHLAHEEAPADLADFIREVALEADIV